VGKTWSLTWQKGPWDWGGEKAAEKKVRTGLGLGLARWAEKQKPLEKKGQVWGGLLSKDKTGGTPDFFSIVETIRKNILRGGDNSQEEKQGVGGRRFFSPPFGQSTNRRANISLTAEKTKKNTTGEKKGMGGKRQMRETKKGSL